MSVKELSFDDGYIKFSKPLPDRIMIKIDVIGAVAILDRNQADLLRLWLEEHINELR